MRFKLESLGKMVLVRGFKKLMNAGATKITLSFYFLSIVMFVFSSNKLIFVEFFPTWIVFKVLFQRYVNTANFIFS